MAELLDALAQEPIAGPPDPATKRAKFLSNFQKLDPEAELDEAGLNSIFSDTKQRDEFAQYVSKLNPDFKLTGEEFADELGYTADVKKKPSGDVGSMPTEQLASPAGALPEGDTEFAAQPQVLPLGYQLPGAPLPAAELAADAEAARVYAPGFTGPVPAGTYERPSDRGTPTQGTQYFGEQQPIGQPEAADVADDGFWASLGKSLYNGLDAKRISGNLLDYGGDLIELLANNTAYDDDGTPLTPINELGKPLTGDKYSDAKGAELLAAAQASDLPLNEAARASAFANPSLAATGNLLGSGIASIIPVAAASAVGGPLAGAGVGGALGISGTKDAARAAGIADDEATVMATVLAPIQAALEAVGVQDAGLSKLAVRATLREAVAAGGGKLTAQALGAAAKQVIPEIGRRAASGAGREALTEFLQGVAEGEAKVVADALRDNPEAAAGQGRYGTTQGEVFVSAAEQAAAGALLGGALGVTHGTGTVAPTAAAPIQADPNTVYYVAGDTTTTAEGSIADVRILGPGTAPGTVRVKGVDFDGNQVEHDVERYRLAPQAELDAMQAEEDAQQTTPAPEAGIDPVLAAPPDGAPTPFPADRTAAIERLNRMQQRLAERQAAQASPEAALESATITNEPAEVAPTPPSTPEPEPSPAEAPAAPEPTPELPAAPPELLPAAEPHPDHAQPLTTKQQATNAALDTLDSYNALNGTQQKSAEGKAKRREAIAAAGKAGLKLKDVAGKLKVDGPRVTRSNEYTATTPASNHVPLAERPEPVRQFAENALAATNASIAPLQGIGIKLRGKELNARELQGSVEDIRAGKNTLRAQLVLDALENAHRQGYVEKSEGTGLATRKYQVPVGEYVGAAQPGRKAVELSDPELDQLIADDPKVRQAVDDYIRPDGSVDYQKLADEENALPFLFELSEESSAKLATYARERAQQPIAPDRPAGAAPDTATEPRSEAQGPARTDEAAPASRAEVAPEALTGPSEEKKAQIRAEIGAASQRIKDRRAARKKEGKALSSPLPIGEIDVEDLKDALSIARGHVQLGVLGIKNIIAKIREAGLSEEDASDAALTPHLRELLTGEPAPELPANEPQGSATRRSIARLDADPTTPEALKERVRDTGLDKYEPKSLAETEKAIDDYMARNSLSDAYAEAVSTTDNLTGDVRTALRVRVLRVLGDQLTAALDRGDTASADAYLEQAEKVTEAIAKRGTDAGREINAYKLLVVQSPEAAVYKAQKEVAAQRDQAGKKLGKKLRTERKAIAKAKAEALDNALATPAVRQAREKVAGKVKPNTKEKLADVRQQRAALFDELRALSKKKPTVAMVAVVPITPQQVQSAAIHVKIFATYIQEGVLRVTALVERLRREGGAAVVGTDQELRQQAAAALRDNDEAIQQGTAELGRTLDQIARDHLSDAGAIGKTLAEQFVAGAGLTPSDAQAYASAIEAEFAKRIAAARQRRLAELDKRAAAAPAKRPKVSDVQATQELFTLSPTDDAAILEHLKRVNDLPELTTQDVAELRKLAQAVQKAPEGFQRDEAVEKLLKKQASIKGVSWAEIGQAMWYANVLSGYKTHVINFTANVIQTGAELGVNTTHALLTGQGRYAAASGKGLFKGLRRGVREAVSVLTTGRETSREPGKYEVPGILENVRFAGGAANPANYLKLVSRALRAGDMLFSGGLKEMRAYEQAVKFALEDAKSDGTPNQDIWARAAEKLYNTQQRIADARTQAQAEGLKGNDLERRVYEIAEQSRGAEVMEDARVYAPRAVFNGEVEGVLGVVSNGIQQITEAVNVKGVKPLKFIVPFTRVITNVANAYLDYTPVGAARAIKGSHFVKEGSTTQREFTREERQKLVIKSVIGGAVMAAAFAASGSEKDDERLLEITGAGTGNPTKDAQLRADGWQPYSFKVNGTWYSYANAPIGAMLAVVGNVNDGQKYRGELLSDDDGALNSLYLGAWRAMQFTKDMTALKSATDFLTALSSRNAVDLTNYGQRLAVGTVKGFVPFSSFLTQTAKDAEQLAGEPRKQGRSFGQMLAQDIPVARNGINNALDALGDSLPVDTDRLFSAPPHRDEPTQRIWDWLNKNNLFISVPNRHSGGALVLRAHEGKEDSMTDDEYYEFMKNRGDAIKTLLSSRMDQLEKLDPKAAKAVLDEISEGATERAKVKTFFPNGLQ